MPDNPSSRKEGSINGWTVLILKEFVDRMFIENDRRYEARFQSQDNAVRIALESTERTNSKVDQQMKDVQDRLNRLEQSQSSGSGARGQSDSSFNRTMVWIGVIASIIMAVVAVVTSVVPRRY